MNNRLEQSEDSKENENNRLELKVYSQPKIIELGAVQKVTLGGSIGPGDSGSPFNTEQP